MISFKTNFHHCSKMQGRRRYLSALLQFIHVFHLFFAKTPQENQTHLSDSQKILLLQTLSHQLILWNEMYWTEILKWTILAVYELLLSDCNFSLVGEALVPLYEIPFFFWRSSFLSSIKRQRYGVKSEMPFSKLIIGTSQAFFNMLVRVFARIYANACPQYLANKRKLVFASVWQYILVFI